NPANGVKIKPKSMETTVRPRPQLVADAIAERVGDALDLVFVLPFQNCEQNFPRRAHQCVSSGAPRYLDKSQQPQTRRNRHCRETEHADKRQCYERKRHAEPLEKTACKKDLNDNGDCVDPDFQIREENCPVLTGLERRTSEIALLKVGPSRCGG